jgi:hypothetical protein
MMKRTLPALVVSALFVATPALAGPGSITAMHNGMPVQLRAEYVPASRFAARTNDQAMPMEDVQAGAGQGSAVDYRDAMLAAGYAPDGSLLPAEAAASQPAQYAPAAYAPPAYPQAGYPQVDPQAAYPQAGYPPAGYVQSGYGGYPPPLPVVHTRQVVPVAYPVPVGYGAPVGWRGNGWRGNGWNRGFNRGWGGGYGRGWNRGWNQGWNRGFGGYGGGYYRGGGWGCRSSGAGALVGSVAGAALGYGVANPWDRGTGVVIGGIVGALAGTALERSNRCY